MSVNTGGIEQVTIEQLEVKIEELQSVISKQQQLLDAVYVDTYQGVYCCNVEEKNWFDVRDGLKI